MTIRPLKAPPPPALSDDPPWHTLETGATLAALGTDPGRGLGDEEAGDRLARLGPNELIDRGVKSPWKILWEQLTAVMVLILIAAAGLSAFLEKWLEAGAILAIFLLFAGLGFLQEYRAERAIAALKRLAVPVVRARRGGDWRELSARDLVPGDVIALEAGNVVPADVRLLESANLRVQEAALTGESEPVEKEVAALTRADAPLGDRRNLGFMGTTVTYGRGTAVVVETGMRTQLGRIATLIQDVKGSMTPLQARLDRVGKGLAAAGVVVAVLILALGLLAGETFEDMLLTAISVAVAVVPEGLPAVVTFTLALGAQKMLRRNALIRKLPAVETLGSVTTICSDKTGTLTENRMTVTVLDVAGERVDLSPTLHARMPALERGDAWPGVLLGTSPLMHLTLAVGALCNDARVRLGEGGRLETLGDPTEGALLVAAANAGLAQDEMTRALPRVAELPFDSERKRMTTVHARAEHVPDGLGAVLGRDGLDPGLGFVAFTKGAVDGLLDLSTQVFDGSGVRPLDSGWRRRIEGAQGALARDGMRVLGVAFRLLDAPLADERVERDLVFLGLVGMIDPPRPEVREAVARCRAAGIRPIMITGDHPLTASFIARDLGISTNERVVTGVDLAKMTDADLERAVADVNVFARVSPEHKLRIVEALQRRGQVVAMTGDGVNDAPALKKADIGVAMGITGTDVSKEAADMVLRDDNFATIVAAVEEGRTIYDNLRRFVRFAITGNVGKVGVMLLWPLPFALLGLPLDSAVALLPLQLLWLNLMTDGLLGLAMGVEKPERGVMARPPQSPREGLFSGGMGWQVACAGVYIAAVALAVGFAYYGGSGGGAATRGAVRAPPARHLPAPRAAVPRRPPALGRPGLHAAPGPGGREGARSPPDPDPPGLRPHLSPAVSSRDLPRARPSRGRRTTRAPWRKGMFRHVLVTTDGSPLGDLALPHAGDLARRYGATLTLLHVVPPLPVGVFAEGAAYVDAEEVWP
ncbi:HAD-IC family P-type ATPase [Deinococcus aestuarii]|uniref:HAD-IC family P-type ATPase n=1 Tax=Deinococcus aestuarii TaxID=2774531 RepID=UPI001C0E7F9F|nr:HAD-IC family P-type ATPase [Deinococcus aestuarii]